MTLTSCAYYGDIHGNSRQLDAAKLSSPHVYKPTSAPTTVSWWGKFKDPELNQLINTALTDSPTMLVAEARVRTAQHIAESAGAELWPEVDMSGSFERERFSKYGLIPPPFNGGTYNIATVGFNFNYEFDFWGKRRQLLAARISEQYAAAADLAQAKLVLAAAVADTYFSVLANIALRENAQANWRVNQAILQIAQTRMKHGIESDIPVKTIQANMQATKLALERYRNSEMLARNQLAVLLGNNPFATTIQTRRFTFKNYRVTLPSSLPARLLANRPDIYAAKLRAQAAASEINVAKANFFPDINLNGLFSYQSIITGKLFNPQSQNNAGSVAFDLPIFDAGARRANLGVRYAEYDVAVNDYNQTLLTALRQVADEAATLRALTAELKAQDTAVNASAHNYKLTHSRYNHGIADYTRVLESKQALLQQQSTQLQLQTRQTLAVVAMLKALGGNDSRQRNADG